MAQGEGGGEAVRGYLRISFNFLARAGASLFFGCDGSFTGVSVARAQTRFLGLRWELVRVVCQFFFFFWILRFCE